MRFPVGDWQFWVATILAVVALAWVLRGLIPVPILSRGKRRQRQGIKRATLTIEGRSVADSTVPGAKAGVQRRRDADHP